MIIDDSKVPLFQSLWLVGMASTNAEQQQDEDAAELTFPKEFETAETLLISEVRLVAVKHSYGKPSVNVLL